MSFRNKILLILGFCVIISLGSFFIIKSMFNSLEEQLLEKCHIETLIGADVMGEIVELLIETTPLTERDVFDYNYNKIPGTDPQKYTTRYSSVFDEHIQDIQDTFLKDSDLIFAVLMDKNGYVPTHNSIYSQPITGNKPVDLVYSRSKRIFSGSPAIRKVIDYTGPETIKVFYIRDTGEKMWNMGAPVFINDKHWGSFIIGVSLERIDDLKNQMMLLTLAIMFVIMSLTMLIILAVIPRSMLPSDLR